MTEKPPFDPGKSIDHDLLDRQVKSILANPDIGKVLDAIPEAVLILNRQRRIVYVNDSARHIVNNEQLKFILGLQVGDMLDCENAKTTADGCGSTESCAFCGAVNAILSSQKGTAHVEEARISLKSGESLDLKVKASPFMDGDETYTVFSFTDISAEKRKQVLERTFFHDILNTASGLSGYSELLLEASQSEVDAYKGTIYNLTRSIVDEIKAQQMLIDAESGELDTMPVETNSLGLWQQIVDFYSQSPVADSKTIEIDADAEAVHFVVDEVLLSRVLGNMLKNALEASSNNSAVQVTCCKKGDRVEFSVTNQKAMPRTVQMQLFKRSFSTKGKGRGIGTYSMKMLGEKYLKGSVDFTSSEAEGTTFTASFPLKPVVG